MIKDVHLAQDVKADYIENERHYIAPLKWVKLKQAENICQHVKP